MVELYSARQLFCNLKPLLQRMCIFFFVAILKLETLKRRPPYLPQTKHNRDFERKCQFIDSNFLSRIIITSRWVRRYKRYVRPIQNTYNTITLTKRKEQDTILIRDKKKMENTKQDLKGSTAVFTNTPVFTPGAHGGVQMKSPDHPLTTPPPLSLSHTPKFH